MAIHRDLGNAELHEPKGILPLTGGASDIGKVIVSDGAGGSIARFLTSDEVDATKKLNKFTVINQLSDLPTPSGGTIQLADNTVYIFGDDVNIGTDNFTWGDNTVIYGIDRDNVLITYTGTNPMIESTNTNVLVDNIRFDHPNGELILHTDNDAGGYIVGVCNFFSVRSKGGIRTNSSATTKAGLLLDNIAALNNVTFDYINVQGSGLRFLSSIACTYITTGAYAFDLNSAVLDSISIVRNGILLLDAASGFLKGLANSGNISSGNLANVRESQIQNIGGGTLLSGITETDVRYRFDNNTNIQDTRPDSLINMRGNTTVTTISGGDGDAGNPKKVAGTWTNQRLSQFTFDTSGRVTYVGEKPFTMPVDISVSAFSASGSPDAAFYIALNGTAILDSRIFMELQTDPTSGHCIWQHTFVNGDYIELFVTNEDNTTNITVDTALIRVN